MSRWMPAECACCRQMTAYVIQDALYPRGVGAHTTLATVRCDRCRLRCPNRLPCKTKVRVS